MKNWKLAAASAVLPWVLAACGGGDDDSDPPPAAAAEQHIASVEFIGRYESGSYGVSAAEIPAYDPATRRAFVVHALSGKIEELDLSKPARPPHLGTLDADAVLDGAGINRVAARDGRGSVRLVGGRGWKGWVEMVVYGGSPHT